LQKINLEKLHESLKNPTETESTKPKKDDKDAKKARKIREEKLKASIKAQLEGTKKPETKPEIKPGIKKEIKKEIKPEIKKEIKPEIKKEVLPIHERYICDVCDADPIIGTRFKCFQSQTMIFAPNASLITTNIILWWEFQLQKT